MLRAVENFQEHQKILSGREEQDRLQRIASNIASKKLNTSLLLVFYI
jgi:hypothetical protein